MLLGPVFNVFFSIFPHIKWAKWANNFDRVEPTKNWCFDGTSQTALSELATKFPALTGQTTELLSWGFYLGYLEDDYSCMPFSAGGHANIIIPIILFLFFPLVVGNPPCGNFGHSIRLFCVHGESVYQC